MGVENGGPGDLDKLIEDEGYFDYPISIPKDGRPKLTDAELEAERDRLAAGGRTAAELRQTEPNQPRGELAIDGGSEARREETSPMLWDTQSVVDLEDARKRSEEAAAEASHRLRVAERDAEAAAQKLINDRARAERADANSKTYFVPPETFADRNARETSERQAALRAQVAADKAKAAAKGRDYPGAANSVDAARQRLDEIKDQPE